MTDPVAALAAALETVNGLDEPFGYGGESAEVLAALRASGFDVVPTGDAGPAPHANLCWGGEFCVVDDCICECHRVPTGDAGLDAELQREVVRIVGNGEWWAREYAFRVLSPLVASGRPSLVIGHRRAGMSDPHDIPIGYGNCDGCWRHKSGALWFDPTCPVHSPAPTEPGTPQTAADHSCANHDETLDEAYRKGVRDGRAARDAEVRAAVEGLPKYRAVRGSAVMTVSFDRVLAILDADTPS